MINLPPHYARDVLVIKQNIYRSTDYKTFLIISGIDIPSKKVYQRFFCLAIHLMIYKIQFRNMLQIRFSA